MRKVINGKSYNTETAEYLGYWQHLLPNDWRYEREELYRTSKGNYFVYGEGGPLSQYRVTCYDGTWIKGKNIRVLTKEEAMEWAETSLPSGKYEAIFGEVEEG